MIQRLVSEGLDGMCQEEVVAKFKSTNQRICLEGLRKSTQ